jgi:glycosyltransferase involved in cell wall biosynthesis
MKKLSSFSFFCPAYFDEKNLPKVIDKAVELCEDISEKYEIIIVEDGSPDKTGEVADDLARQYQNVRVIHHRKNRGYGGALKTGFNSCRYDYVAYIK